MDIDKLILRLSTKGMGCRFSSLMDIDKLIPLDDPYYAMIGFSSLMDIDKLILTEFHINLRSVLVL